MSAGTEPKLAYLILGHAHPEQIVRLIEALRPSAALFVIHIDRRSDDSVMQALEAYAGTVQDVRFAVRHRCYWGSYGIMRATFSLIRTLLAQEVAFSYAALISGQDYPTASAERMAAFFAQRPEAEFIEAFSLVKPNRWTPHAGRFQSLNRVLNTTVWLRSRPFHLPLRRRFYAGWEPHGGSQWWCLSREAIVWLDRYVRQHAGLGWYFRLVFIPDEAMIQSMMANSPFAGRISDETLTYIDWDRPNPKYPRTLDDEDLERLRASGKLFARKMHPERSRELMDRIDRELLG